MPFDLVVGLLDNFPHEAVPDGRVGAPHHYTYLLMAAMLAAGTVWDDYRDKEPIAVFALLGGGLIAFNLMWPLAHYRPMAPAATIILPLIAVALIVLPFGNWRFWPWERQRPYPIGTSWVVVLLILAGLDDAIEHALGTPMPLDWFFVQYGTNASAVFGIVAVAFLVVVVYSWDHLYDLLNLGPPE